VATTIPEREGGGMIGQMTSSVLPHKIVVAAGSPEEARDLARLLARHGLSGQVVGGYVEMLSGHERMNSVLADLAVALGRWLEDRQRRSISLVAGDRRLRFDRSGRYAVERRHKVAS
jgi:hypothetical protein